MSNWTDIQQQLADARCPIEVLPADPLRAEQVVRDLHFSSGSALGAIATYTGGILLDHRWLRVLGAGHERLRGTLLTWNGLGQGAFSDPLSDALIFAHDALGGFFALNQGAFSGDVGAIHYFAPVTLEWEPLHNSYAEFLNWALRGSLRDFYQPFLWTDWEVTMPELPPDCGYSIYPPLWAAGPEIGARSRRAVPMTELWSLQRDLAGQLANLPEGTAVRL